MGYEDSNSDPHIDRARILHTKLFPQSPVFLLNWYRIIIHFMGHKIIFYYIGKMYNILRVIGIYPGLRLLLFLWQHFKFFTQHVLFLFTLINGCVWRGAGVWGLMVTHVPWPTLEVRDNFWELVQSFTLCGFWSSDSDCHTWWKWPLHNKLFDSPISVIFIL